MFRTVSRPLFRLLSGAALVALTCVPGHADLYGAAEVLDGNTLLVGGQTVRLFGIDAPELNQTCDWPEKVIECGKMSRSAALDLIAGVQRVSCKPRGRDSGGRWIAICYANGSDIGRHLVHAGWAMADRTRSLNYIRTEHRAKNAKRGMWKGEFDPPWVWRGLNK